MSPSSCFPRTPAKVASSPSHQAFLLWLPRKAQESQKEMKLLLDMYKSAPKEQRDKVQLMAAERKAKAEVRTGRACRACTEAALGSADQSSALGQQQAVASAHSLVAVG